jgi:hypothetical protein
MHRAPDARFCGKGSVRVADFGFKDTGGIAPFPSTRLTANVQDFLLLLSETLPDCIGRLPNASFLDQLPGHRHQQVVVSIDRLQSFVGLCCREHKPIYVAEIVMWSTMVIVASLLL